MTEDEYQRWKADPLTTKFHQFLRDYRQQIMEQWATGQFASASMEQMAQFSSREMGRAMMLDALCELADDAISEFYRKPPKEESKEDER